MADKMKSSDINSSKNSRHKQPLNWLNHFDKNAKLLDRAVNWTQYSDFTFVRHPHLQPELFDLSNPPRIKQLNEGKKSFEKRLDYWQKRLQKDAPEVFEDLTPAQQRQLSALISDCSEDLELHEIHKASAQSLSDRGKEAPRRMRRLKNEYDSARTALEVLADYAESLHPLLECTGLHRTATECLERLKGYEFPSIQEDSWNLRRQGLAQVLPCKNNPLSISMVYLFWFFHSECKCKKNEAEIRTAILRIKIWDRTVAYTPEYDGIMSKSCNTVRQAVSRYKLS